MAADNVDDLIKELEGLRIRQNHVLDRLRAARQRENEVVAEPPLGVGDRVRILNAVHRPFGWAPPAHPQQDRIGTVTRVTATRIYITTDTAIVTWRARHNVERIN